MNQKTIKMAAVLAGAVLVLLSAVQCSDKPVPVTELNDARLELSKAKNEDAEKHASELYKRAEKALLDAHSMLSENERKESAAKALESYENSVRARLIASPLFTQEKKDAASLAIESAEKAMADSFATAEYNEAVDLFKSAVDSHDKAKTAKSELPADSKEGEKSDPDINVKKQKVLASFEDAYTKYSRVQASANAARTRALARSNELTAAANRIEARLKEAQAMGAQQTSPDAYNRAMNDLNQAKAKIASGDLKEANALLKNAEQLANTVFTAAQESQARKLADQAKASLDSAKRAVSQRKASAPASEENKAVFSKLDDFIKAGDEGLASAENNYRNRRYDASIKDSNEVINLSKIITADLSKVSDIDKEALAAKEREAARLAAEQAEKERLARLAAEQAEKERLAKQAAEQAEKERLAKQAAEEAEKERQKKESMVLPEGWIEYIVRVSNSLWKIARRPEIYGRGSEWRRIYEANKDQIKNPDLIYPGQVLKVPPKN